MAEEKLKIKLLVTGIDSTDDPVTDLASANAAKWKEEPLTLRDDEVIVQEAEPDEEEVYSHENDDPEDVEYTEGATEATGSFVKPTLEQLVGLMGGKKEDTAYIKPRKKAYIDRAVRFRLKDGGFLVLPRAKGFVLLNIGVGRGSRAKFPFKLKALVPAGGDTALIWETEKEAPANPANNPIAPEE